MGYGFMVVSAVCESSFLYKWKSKGTTFIATLSYAVYLTHKGVIHVTHELLGKFELNDNLMLLICVVTSLLGALALHHTIEKPFMTFRNRIINQKKT